MEPGEQDNAGQRTFALPSELSSSSEFTIDRAKLEEFLRRLANRVSMDIIDEILQPFIKALSGHPMTHFNAGNNAAAGEIPGSGLGEQPSPAMRTRASISAMPDEGGTEGTASTPRLNASDGKGSSSIHFPSEQDIVRRVEELQQPSTPGSSWMTPTTSSEASGSAGTSQASPNWERMANGNGTPASAGKRSRVEDSNANNSQQQPVVIWAHQGAVVAVKLDGDFIYSCSGSVVKRHSLKNSGQCVEYHGSSGEVKSLEVWRPKKPQQPGALYTASQDGNLRCYNTETGKLTATFEIGPPIICSTLAWDKIYLGLETGSIQVFDVKKKEQQEAFECFDVDVHCITTATAGSKKEKFLCAVSARGAVVVRSVPNNRMLWNLEECLHPLPPCVSANGSSLYLTGPGEMVHVYDLKGGNKQKSFAVKCDAMGICFSNNYIIICSANNKMCFYRTKDFAHEIEYNTEPRSQVTGIDVNSPMIATGNGDGSLEIFRFDKSELWPCRIQGCGLQFVRKDDLMVHIVRGHRLFA